MGQIYVYVALSAPLAERLWKISQGILGTAASTVLPDEPICDNNVNLNDAWPLGAQCATSCIEVDMEPWSLEQHKSRRAMEQHT